MIVSEGKTKFMVIGRNRSSQEKYSVRIGRKEVEQVKEYKFLGVHVDDEITMRAHLRELETKARKSVGALKRLAGLSFRPSTHSLRMFHTAVVAPTVEYGIAAYYPLAAESDSSILKPIESLVVEAAGVVMGLPAGVRPNHDALLREAGLQGLRETAVHRCARAHAQALTAGSDNMLHDAVFASKDDPPFVVLAKKNMGGISPIVAEDEYCADPAAVSLDDLISGGDVRFDPSGELVVGEPDCAVWTDGACIELGTQCKRLHHQAGWQHREISMANG
jgi:hypothetical protein